MTIGSDCIGIFVSAVCHDGYGHFLMSKRSEKARDKHGHWEFGGGTVELGESFEETLRCEYKEEYQAELTDIKQIDVREFIDEDGHWIGVFYIARILNPDALTVTDDAIEMFDWFTLETLPSPLMADDEKYVESYVNQI